MIYLFTIEILLAAALCVGFMYEEQIAAIEKKLFRKIKKLFKGEKNCL
jgi:hypothetical protein